MEADWKYSIYHIAIPLWADVLYDKALIGYYLVQSIQHLVQFFLHYHWGVIWHGHIFHLTRWCKTFKNEWTVPNVTATETHQLIFLAGYRDRLTVTGGKKKRSMKQISHGWRVSDWAEFIKRDFLSFVTVLSHFEESSLSLADFVLAQHLVPWQHDGLWVICLRWQRK